MKKETTMKIRKPILLGALVAALVIGATVLLTHAPRTVGPVVDVPEPAEVTAQPPAPSATVAVARTVPTTSITPNEAVVDLPEVAHEPADALRVRTGRVLAEVNGKPIQLHDLVPLEAQETEKMMTPEEYESRLNRAIEMELTFQAAAAGGVDLTPEQKRRVDGVAQKDEASLQEYRKQGVTWSSVTPAQVEFEKRLTSALMLQQNLVAKVDNATPSPDAATQARYEDALRELIVRLKSSADIATL